MISLPHLFHVFTTVYNKAIKNVPKMQNIDYNKMEINFRLSIRLNQFHLGVADKLVTETVYKEKPFRKFCCSVEIMP